MLNLVLGLSRSAKLYKLMKALAVYLKKKSILLLFAGLLGISCFGQGPGPKSDFWTHVRFGGGIGLGFGNDSFSFAISPAAIYEFSPMFASGIGLQYNYSEFRDSKFNAIGGSIMSFFNPIPAIQLSAEFEQIRVNRRENFGDIRIEEKYWVPALFFGAGFGNRNVMVGLRYDVLYDSRDSLYANAWVPFVRVFF